MPFRASCLAGAQGTPAPFHKLGVSAVTPWSQLERAQPCIFLTGSVWPLSRAALPGAREKFVSFGGFTPRGAFTARGWDKWDRPLLALSPPPLQGCPEVTIGCNVGTALWSWASGPRVPGWGPSHHWDPLSKAGPLELAAGPGRGLAWQWRGSPQGWPCTPSVLLHGAHDMATLPAGRAPQPVTRTPRGGSSGLRRVCRRDRASTLCLRARSRCGGQWGGRPPHTHCARARLPEPWTQIPRPPTRGAWCL